MSIETEGPQALRPALSEHYKSACKGRVMMLSTDLGVGGGAEEQVMLLSLGLQARGWDVQIVSLLPPSPISVDLETSGIPITSLKMMRGVPDPRALFRLNKELRRFQPDIVHSHMTHANLLARLGRVLHPGPVVINTLHSMTMEKVDGGSARPLEIGHALTARLSDLTTVICRAAVKDYVRSGAVRAGKIAVFPNGVNTSRYQLDADVRTRMRRLLGVDNEFVWLAAGRLEPPKAYSVMIDAFARLAASRSEPGVLLICGQGSLETELRRQVEQRQLAARVKFLGVRTDMAQLMCAADCFVMSSDTEGLPMVLLEASATGLPIIATSVGGNAEVVVDQKSGYLVPRRDADAFASAMERMVQLPENERRRLGSAGSLHTRQNFDIERILDRWENLYASLLETRGSRTKTKKRSGDR